MSVWFFVVTQFAILAYAFVGGVFLAFSDFVMRSLSLTQGSGGVAAMQIINREVFRWIFMALFLGMAAMSFLIAGYAAVYLTGPAAVLSVAAAAVYLAGCFGVTVFFNVPMNETLARMDAASFATRTYWVEIYLPRWTYWNSVRTLSCALSSAMLLAALVWAAQSQPSIH